MSLASRVPSLTLPPVSFVPRLDDKLHRRPRSSSIVEVHEVGGDSAEADLDKSSYTNPNSQWVNGKGMRHHRLGFFYTSLAHCYLLCGWLWRMIGAWLIHPLLIFAGKMVVDALPGMTQQASWTIANLGYCAVCFSNPVPLADASNLTNARIDLVPHVPLCHRHPIPKRISRWCI